MTTQQVRQFDKHAIENLKIPGIILMENAGINCSQIVIDQLKKINGKKVCIICGTGNNGGDGFVIARHLCNYNFDVSVIITGDPEKIKGDAKTNFEIVKNMKLIIESFDTEKEKINKFKNLYSDADIIIDAIFGTGLKGQVKDPYLEIFDELNSTGKHKISIDAPSGLDCDTGQPLGGVIKANQTITLAAMKKGLQTPDAKNFTGEVLVRSIGISLKFAK